MECSPGDVHIWRINLTCGAPEIHSLRTYLSEEELQRSRRFQSPQLQAQWTIARGAMRWILASYLDRSPDELQLRAGAHGKPELDGAPGSIYFNLSHSGPLALLAVTGCGRVGIDLEELCENVEIEHIASSCFAPSESRELLALPAGKRRAAFFATWVRKEAFVKALGVGLSLPLDRFTVASDPDAPARLLSAEGEEPSRWTLLDLAEPNFAAAVAVESNHATLRSMQFESSTLTKVTA
jgi:4'-phosphopantetheinyl transferase